MIVNTAVVALIFSVSVNQKHSRCKKLKLQPRPEKGCDETDVKSKGCGQGLCRNAVDHIKNDDPGQKYFSQAAKH